MAKIRITEIREFTIEMEVFVDTNITTVEKAFEYEKNQYQLHEFDVYDITGKDEIIQSTFELVE